jgi:hypothetical protein
MIEVKRIRRSPSYLDFKNCGFALIKNSNLLIDNFSVIYTLIGDFQ